MAIDYSTNLGKLRAEINDTVEPYELADDQLQSYLDTSYDNIVKAAIKALRALVLKYSKTAGDMYRVDTIEYQEGKTKAASYKSILDDLQDSVANGTNENLVGIPHAYGIYADEYAENRERQASGELLSPKTQDDAYTTRRTKNQEGPYYNG